MIRRVLRLALPLLALLALCACGGGGEESPGLQLYFPAAPTENGVYSKAVDGEDYAGVAAADALMDALLAGPTQPGLEPLLDGDVWLLGWTLTGGTLQVDMSSAYGDLAGVDLTLADCCITLTLRQLEGVERVHITVGGSDLPYRAHQVLTGDDMLFTGAEEEPRQVFVELYFPRSAGRGLGFEVRELTLTEDDDLYAAVTRALLSGPESSALRTLFPEGIKVMDTRVDNGICNVNFSADLVENAPADPAEQELLLYSIVDTLGNLDAVNAVQLLVEGEVLKSYGNTDTTLPLEPDFGLVGN